MKSNLLCLLLITSSAFAQDNSEIINLFDNAPNHPRIPPVEMKNYNNNSNDEDVIFSTKNNNENSNNDYYYNMWQKRNTCETVLNTKEDYQTSVPFNVNLETVNLKKYSKSFYFHIDNQISFASYNFYLIDENNKVYNLPNVKYSKSNQSFYALSLVPMYPKASCIGTGNYLLLFHAKDVNGNTYNAKTNVTYTDDRVGKISKIIKTASPVEE